MGLQRPSNEEAFLRRLAYLHGYAKERNGQWKLGMEVLLYDLLETHQSRPRAIARYICFAAGESWALFVANTRWYARLWWLRYARRMSEEQIADLLEKAFFDAFYKMVKGENNDATN